MRKRLVIISAVLGAIALGHNGQRTKDGGRQVVFAGGDVRWVSGVEWASFLEEQDQLLHRRSERAQAGEPLVTAAIELPDATRIEGVEGHYSIRERSQGHDSSGSGSSSGSGLTASTLRWHWAPLQDGAVTRTLAFSNLISAPVTVRFSNGVPDVTNVVFKMRSNQ